MQMTFNQYIDNPLGKRNAVFSKRSMYRELYVGKFDAVLLREAGKIDYVLYQDKKKDEYYCHIKIPSEVVPKFYYDVVIHFYSDQAQNRTEKSLENYYVQFYSNDPSFVFTYLRVFLKNDMFVEELKEKSPKKALKEDPVITNPYEIPGYVKSIYFAYLYMKNKGLFAKINYDLYAKPFKKKDLINSVENADEKIAKRQEEGQRVAKDTRKAKASETAAKQNEYSNKVNSINKFTSKVSTAPTTKRSNVVRSVKTAKITKPKR